MERKAVYKLWDDMDGAEHLLLDATLGHVQILEAMEIFDRDSRFEYTSVELMQSRTLHAVGARWVAEEMQSKGQLLVETNRQLRMLEVEYKLTCPEMVEMQQPRVTAGSDHSTDFTNKKGGDRSPAVEQLAKDGRVEPVGIPPSLLENRVVLPGPGIPTERTGPPDGTVIDNYLDRNEPTACLRAVVSQPVVVPEMVTEATDIVKSDPPRTVTREGSLTRSSVSELQERGQRDSAAQNALRNLGHFDGSGDFELFAVTLEAIAQRYCLDEQEKLISLLTALRGDAEQIVPICKGKLDYITLSEKLRQRFSQALTPEQARWALKHCHQREDETIPELAARIEGWAVVVAPQLDPVKRDQYFSIPHFLDALADPYISFELWRRRVSTMAEAVKEARFLQELCEWKARRCREDDLKLRDRESAGDVAAPMTVTPGDGTPPAGRTDDSRDPMLSEVATQTANEPAERQSRCGRESKVRKRKRARSLPLPGRWGSSERVVWNTDYHNGSSSEDDDSPDRLSGKRRGKPMHSGYHSA
jgi:hypothetical protein